MTECQFGCGKELVWDKSRKSTTGKMIPIEKATNEPHNCPNSPYNKSKKAGVAPQVEQPQLQQTMDNSQANLSLAERITVLEDRLGTLATDVAGILVRLNKLDGA